MRQVDAGFEKQKVKDQIQKKQEEDNDTGSGPDSKTLNVSA